MKRRKGLDRRTPLRSRSSLDRGKPIRKRNPERKRKEFTRAFGSIARVEAVKAMPCIACGRSPSENAHIPSQSGAGRRGDARWIVPLCIYHHRELDRVLGPGPFAQKYGLDMEAEARRVAAILEAP